MRRYAQLVFLLTLGGMLTVVRPSGAQVAVCGLPSSLEPVAFETITVSTVAIGLTESVFNGVSATVAFLTVEAQPLRYTTFGTPTATEGHLVEPPATGNADAGKGAWFCGQKTLTQLRLIRAGATDSTVRVTYYRLP